MADAVYNPNPTGGSAPPESSGIAKTLGVMSIIFGSLVALFSLFALVQRGAPRFAQPRGVENLPELQQIQERLQQAIRDTAQYTMALAGLMLLMSVALIVIGVGLYRQRQLARKAALAWSLAAFVVLGLRIWINETKIWPRLEPAMREMMSRAMEIAFRAQGKGPTGFNGAGFVDLAHKGELASAAGYALWPILLLILLNLQSVKQRLTD